MVLMLVVLMLHKLIKVSEKDFNQMMALKLEELFKNHSYIDFSLTRRTDVFLELKDRVKIANSQPADLFLSIHANATSSSSNGTETYYNRTTSAPLAGVIQRHMLLLRDSRIVAHDMETLP